MNSERTDREMLELAAKAAGWEFFWKNGTPYLVAETRDSVTFGRGWNPLEDDGDALRLAVSLDMIVTVNRVDERTEVACGYSNDNLVSVREPHGGDIYAATRRAIVRAAAAMAEGGEQ